MKPMTSQSMPLPGAVVFEIGVLLAAHLGFALTVVLLLKA
jgi:hypothetical protein